jgi:hypothetical protein
MMAVNPVPKSDSSLCVQFIERKTRPYRGGRACSYGIRRDDSAAGSSGVAAWSRLETFRGLQRMRGRAVWDSVCSSCSSTAVVSWSCGWMQTTGGQRSKSRVAVARCVNSRLHYCTHCHGESRFEDQNKNILRLSAAPALVCVFAPVLQLHFANVRLPKQSYR